MLSSKVLVVAFLLGVSVTRSYANTLDNDDDELTKKIKERYKALCNSNQCRDNPGKPVKEVFDTEDGYVTIELSCPKVTESVCKEGYHDDGAKCEDIDECTNRTHNCSQNANCTNTKGSFNCTCVKGYHGDGITCNDIDECTNGSYTCSENANCTNTKGSFNCTCVKGYHGDGVTCKDKRSCSTIKMQRRDAPNGNYVIDPDSTGGQLPFTVYCDMTDKGGMGVTVISHDSEARTLVPPNPSHGSPGSYSRNVTYQGVSLTQLAQLTRVCSHCEQFIMWECYNSPLLYNGQSYGWWVSRNGNKMNYWGGATPGSGKCACGMTNSCADTSYGCNCDKDDPTWRSDEGLLTDKATLPVRQMRFGDLNGSEEKGYRTLGKLRCYGTP